MSDYKISYGNSENEIPAKVQVAYTVLTFSDLPSEIRQNAENVINEYLKGDKNGK